MDTKISKNIFNTELHCTLIQELNYWILVLKSNNTVFKFKPKNAWIEMLLKFLIKVNK